MNLKEGDLLYDGTNVFQVTAYIAEPQVTIKPIGMPDDIKTYPLSKLPKGMVKLVPEIEIGKKQRVGKRKRRLTQRKTSNLSPSGKLSFRANSKIQRAYQFLKTQAKPTTVAEILQGIGEPVTPSSKVNLASDLYRAVNKGGEIKLINHGLFAYQESQSMTENKDSFHLPDNFGKDDL